MSLDRRQFLQAGAGAAAASALGLSLDMEVFAKAPFAGTQTPSYYRFKVGATEVTALADGIVELPLSLFPGVDAAKAKALLIRARRSEATPTNINSYVINTGDQLILVDTGYGSLGGPDTGQLLPNLKAAGYEPGQVDAVVITHMHPDHIGGLLDQTGKPTFPNATLLVSGKEYDFWTDESTMSKAPADAQKYFKMAQAGVKPYEKNLQKLRDGEAVGTGVNIFAAPGHTPGHSTVRVSSGKDSLLIWGDIVHVGALQFARPDFAISFDTDTTLAITTRKKLFDQVEADNTLVAGMHLDFPGIGYVNKETEGYSFQEAIWSTKL